MEDPEEQEFTIDRMYPHEEFNKGTYLNHDIIIIRVKVSRLDVPSAAGVVGRKWDQAAGGASMEKSGAD